MDRALLALVSMLFPLLSTPPAEADALPSEAQWKADVREALHGSLAYLDQRVARGGERLAVVLDIDNTSLATEYDWPKPVRPTRRFARHAHDLGVAVIFVTGRYQSTLKGVRPTLKRAGYPITAMCGRQHGEEIVKGKQRCRRQLVRKGWTIIANVGNRPTDMRGGNYERKFKLPNYHGLLG